MDGKKTLHLPDLDEHVLNDDPIVQFKEWYQIAATTGVSQYDAMALATASADGVPSVRMVLLKQVDDRGFVFFTNYNSRKGRDLVSNARAALVLFWVELNRSIRIEGAASQITGGESDAYFASRPRDGQLSSLTSAQSMPVKNREALDMMFDALRQQYDGKTIPRPEHWGGYRVKPERIEFWQARFARLNDRIEYVLQANGAWKKQRLQP